MKDVVYGQMKYTDPDLSVGPEQRAFFAFAPAKELKLQTVQLHDYRESETIIKGTAGLDVHGFTVVNHRSALSGDQWFNEADAENVYLSEVEELVKELTGASKAVIVNASFRRKAATERDEDPGYYKKSTDPQTFDIRALTSEKPRVNGKDVIKSPEPARNIHCDYTFKGLESYIRHGRPDITALAAEVLEAEDVASKTGTPYAGPRYAAFSVWRPLKVVRRDPLVVADFHSIAPADFIPFEYRVPNVDGEFLTEAYMVKPGDVSSQKWYWLPRQRPDEVLVIKLADSEARKLGEEGVAGSTPHGSPILPGYGDEELRESIEVRIIAFW